MMRPVGSWARPWPRELFQRGAPQNGPKRPPPLHPQMNPPPRPAPAHSRMNLDFDIPFVHTARRWTKLWGREGAPPAIMSDHTTPAAVECCKIKKLWPFCGAPLWKSSRGQGLAQLPTGRIMGVGGGPSTRDALEGKGPQRGPQQRFGRRLGGCRSGWGWLLSGVLAVATLRCCAPRPLRDVSPRHLGCRERGATIWPSEQPKPPMCNGAQAVCAVCLLLSILHAVLASGKTGNGNVHRLESRLWGGGGGVGEGGGGPVSGPLWAVCPESSARRTQCEDDPSAPPCASCRRPLSPGPAPPM